MPVPLEEQPTTVASKVSNLASPTGEHVLKIGALGMRDENEKAVSDFDYGTSARRKRFIIACDQRDQSITRQTEFANRRTVDRMIVGDGEVDYVELAHWPKLK